MRLLWPDSWQLRLDTALWARPSPLTARKEEERKVLMRNMIVCGLTACLGYSTIACGSGQKEVRAPEAQVQYDSSSSEMVLASDAGAGVIDAPPPQPPAPDAQQPSDQPATVEVVVDGVTRPLADGETLKIGPQRMLFFYSNAASPDCSNVQVSGLLARSLAGLCQVAFLPLEQGVKPGQERDVSITVTAPASSDAASPPPASATTRRFRVGVL